MRNWAKFGGFAGLTVALLVCAFLLATSYPPLPGFGIEGEHYDCRAKAERDGRKGAAQDGVVIPPLAHADQANGDASKACREERERLQKASNERGLTVATWFLAFATIGLFGAVAIQAALFVWQLRLIRDESVHTKIAAEAAKKSADTAEAALTNVERPWLFAESVRALPVDEHPQPNNRWTISFGFRNIGKMPALTEECIIKIIDKDKAPPVPDYIGANAVSVIAVVGVNVEFKTQGIGPADERPDVRLVFGRLTYKELSGKTHKVGFAVDVAPIGVLTAPYPVDAYHYYD
jgi:hypothetical protein